MSHPSTILSSNSFYDLIAPEYNSYLQSEQNDRVRKHITRIFIATIPTGIVADFGAGTGLDTLWLTEYYLKVYFLEPSSQMRRMAKANLRKHENKILFVEENIEFNNWSLSNLPFAEKVDGILANFAVLNCIPDVSQLFEKIALICKPGGHIVATVLDVRWQALLKKHSLKALMLALIHKTPTIYSSYKGFGHTTYLHSIRDLKKFSGKYFYWKNYIEVKGSPFALMILKRK